MLGSGMFQDRCARWRLQLAENFPFFFENNPESETLVRLVRVRFIKVYKLFRCAELTLFGQLFLCLVCSQMINKFLT